MQAKSSFAIYARLFKSIYAYKFELGMAIVGVILASAAEATISKFIVPPLLDQGVIAKDSKFLHFAPFFILFAFIARGVGDFIGKYFMAYVGRHVVKDHRIKMLQHMLELPVSFFENNTLGKLVSKVNYDAEQIATALAEAVLEICQSFIIIILLLAVMFSISWQITLTVLIVAPIIGIYFKAISKRIRRYSCKVQDTMGTVTQLATEIINAHKIIRAFQGFNFEQQKIQKIISINCKQEIKIALVTAFGQPVIQIIGAIFLAFFVYMILLQHLNITPGESVGLLVAMFGMIRPTKQITQVNNILQRGVAAANSIHQLLDEPKEIDQGKYCFDKANGKIHLEKVTFNYINQECPTINNISFTIQAGETIAIVGSSGGGKSTLASLLPRFYEISSGNIYIDDVDIQDIKLSNLRQQIAIVTQQVILFNDTIANNIAYGNSNASEDEIIQAASIAHVMEFVKALPKGLDTMLGQDGILLSGGQRQRLAIARAILKKAPILILDEATSALDNESERYIQDALEKIIGQCTTIVIAHRLSTIEKADRILVLEQGKIIELGNHTELLAKNSRYAKLYKSQFAEE